jgi:hypothetical protein
MLGFVELELDVLDIDAPDAGAEVRVEEALGGCLGLGAVLDGDAAGGETGAVERLAHPGLQEVADRGVDGEADGSDQRHEGDGEQNRRGAAAVAHQRLEAGAQGNEGSHGRTRPP